MIGIGYRCLVVEDRAIEKSTVRPSSVRTFLRLHILASDQSFEVTTVYLAHIFNPVPLSTEY